MMLTKLSTVSELLVTFLTAVLCASLTGLVKCSKMFLLTIFGGHNRGATPSPPWHSCHPFTEAVFQLEWNRVFLGVNPHMNPHSHTSHACMQTHTRYLKINLFLDLLVVDKDVEGLVE